MSRRLKQILALQVQPVQSSCSTQGRPGKQLRQAGDSRVGREPPVMRLIVPTEPLDILLSQRPRPDHAHFTSQHIDELRQLVDAGAAEPATDPGDVLLAHAAELEDRKRLALAPDSRLCKERRAAVFQPARDRDTSDERRKGRARRASDQHIQRTLAGIGLQRIGFHAATPLR